MVYCLTLACFFCMLSILIGLASVVQFCLGIYLSSIHPDLSIINVLIRTETFNGYLVYILFVFIGLGLVSLLLAFVSIYSTIQRTSSLAVLLSVLWIFITVINLAMLTGALLYHFLVLPQLRSSLLGSLQRSPLATSTLLDSLQSKYSCCGFDQSDDYNNLPLDPFPSSCCRVPNCWRDTDINRHTGMNTTVSLMHNTGCYSTVEKFLELEVWMLVGVSSLAAFLELFAGILICSTRRKDDQPKFVVPHGHSTQTVEITQI